MNGAEIERLIQLLGRLPGLGPRSARRVALHLLKKRETLMQPLEHGAGRGGRRDQAVLDLRQPRHGRSLLDLRRSRRATAGLICVVEDVGDLWAMERGKIFAGRYHVLGGTLSALDGIGPDELNIAGLIARVKTGTVREVIVATNATVDGQTTAHYLAERLADIKVPVTRLAHGVPVGGELDWLDDGTLATAFKARRAL